MTDEKKTFSRGDVVPSDGEYVCVPCGYTHRYNANEQFGECISCLAGSDQGEEIHAEGTEMWEQKQPVDSK